jgi:hypothetical protein
MDERAWLLANVWRSTGAASWGGGLQDALGSLAEADEAESSLRAYREFHRAASFLEGRPGLG